VTRIAFPLSAALLFSGCFAYLPVTEPGQLEPGLSVRARVSPAAGARIAPLLGATDARRLDGTLITQSTDTLIVEVPTVMTDTREFGRTPSQRVSILRSELLEIEVRRLDRVRTAVVVGSAAIIAGTLLARSLKGEPGKEPLPGGGGTDAIVLRFRWP
jgi:hypothetical protein